MKSRIVVAAIMTALVLFTVIMGSRATINICDKSSDKLEQSLNAAVADDWKSAQKYSKELKRYWENRRITALLFANKGEIDAVNERITVLSAIADRKNLSEYEETAAEIAHMLKMLRHEQLITAESFV